MHIEQTHLRPILTVHLLRSRPKFPETNKAPCKEKAIGLWTLTWWKPEKLKAIKRAHAHSVQQLFAHLVCRRKGRKLIRQAWLRHGRHARVVADVNVRTCMKEDTTASAVGDKPAGAARLNVNSKTRARQDSNLQLMRSTICWELHRCGWHRWGRQGSAQCSLGGSETTTAWRVRPRVRDASKRTGPGDRSVSSPFAHLGQLDPGQKFRSEKRWRKTFLQSERTKEALVDKVHTKYFYSKGTMCCYEILVG